jgi:predicted Zn-dependent peptidase
VEGVGGYLNAFTGEETTCFYSKAKHDRFGELVDVLMDMLLHSSFDPAEMEKERGVIKEEVAMYMDQPQHHVQEMLDATLWPEQALGRPVTGTPRSIDTISRGQLTEFHAENYVAANSVVAAAGNLRHEDVVKEVTRRTRGMAAGRRAVFQPVDARQDAPRLKHLKKEVEQTQVALATRTCSRHDERRHALRLLNAILGENMSSRLFQSVREDRGLAYSIYSSLSYFDDAGILSISAGVETEKLEEALKLILAEMRALAEKPPGAAELRRARDYVLGQMELSLENSENLMMYFGEHYLNYGRVADIEQAKRELAQVKPSDVAAAARDFFQSDRLNLAMIGPTLNAKPVANLLRL